MTAYELISVVASFVAVVISGVSLLRTWHLQRQQLRLNEVTEQLSRKQLSVLAAQEAATARARVVADLTKFGSDWYFTITNQGPAPARSVNFELVDCADSPLVEGDYEQKVPIPLLQPGQTTRLLAALHQGSPTRYNAKVSRTNTDGLGVCENFYLSW